MATSNKTAAKINPIWTIFVYRAKLLSLVSKNLKGRYAGSVLGFFWAFINPLLLALIVSFVFTNILKTNKENFCLFIISGMLPWAFFAGSLQEAVFSIPANATLLKQFSLPREFLPLSSVMANFIFLIMGLLVVMPFFAASNVCVFAYIPALFLALLLLFVFTLGLALILSAVYVYFRDVGQILNTLLLFWLWLTPVFYSADMISPEYRFIFQFNPMTPFIGLYRAALLCDSGAMEAFLVAGIWAAGSVLTGYYVFYKQEKDFLKRI